MYRLVKYPATKSVFPIFDPDITFGTEECIDFQVSLVGNLQQTSSKIHFVNIETTQT